MMKNGISREDLIRGRTSGSKGEGIDGDYEKVGKVSAESVLKHTAKNWKQWIGILEKAGARDWKYSEIVVYLGRKHRLTPWWQQGVALGFEIATGKRRTGQDAKGKYMVTATKSISTGVKAIWAFAMSKEGQAVWLKPLMETELKPEAQFETEDGYFGEVRTMAKERRVRLYWREPEIEGHTVLELMLVPRPGGKAILIFNHTGLRDLKVKAKLATRWRAAADGISGALFKLGGAKRRASRDRVSGSRLRRDQ